MLKILRLVPSAVVIIAAALLGSVRYWTALALLIGVVLSFGLSYVGGRYLNVQQGRRRRATYATLIGIALVVAAALAVPQHFSPMAYTGVFPPLLEPGEQPLGPGPPYSSCMLQIKASDINNGDFIVTPTVLVGSQVSALASSEVHEAGPAGYFAREVDVLKPVGEVRVASGPQRTTPFLVDFTRCPEITVELVEFPAGAFYQARNSSSTPSPQGYGGSENTSWKVAYTNDPDIRFTYLPPPTNTFAKVLDPIRSITTFGDLFVFIAALLVATFWVKTLSLLLKWTLRLFKWLLQKVRRKKPPAQTPKPAPIQ